MLSCVSFRGRGVDAAEGAAAQLGIMLPPSLASHTSHAIRQRHTCSACPSACQCPVTRSRSTRSVSLTPPSEDISTAAAEHDAAAAVPAPAAAAAPPLAPTTVNDFVANHNVAPETSLGVEFGRLKTIQGWDHLTEPEGDAAGTTLGGWIYFLRWTCVTLAPSVAMLLLLLFIPRQTVRTQTLRAPRRPPPMRGSSTRSS